MIVLFCWASSASDTLEGLSVESVFRIDSIKHFLCRKYLQEALMVLFLYLLDLEFQFIAL